MGTLLLLVGTWFLVRSVLSLWRTLMRLPKQPPSTQVIEP